MKKVLILTFIFCLVTGCKGKKYRSPTQSMADTIREGETFNVIKTKDFNRNDIVVFDFYGNNYAAPLEEFGKFEQHWERRAYRLIAVSGDSLEIKNGDVFVNGRHVPMVATAKTDYEIRSTSQIPELNELSEQDMQVGQVGDTVFYIATLSHEMVKRVERTIPGIINIRKHIDQRLHDTMYARTAIQGKWRSDNYGPLRIPAPGEKIYVDEVNFKFYHNIPGIKFGENTIKERLYFVMGDNRHRAEDSRFIGVIPHSNMHGIVK